MELQHILFSQGFGTRRECTALIEGGLVRVPGVRGRADAWICTRPAEEFESPGLRFEVRGEPWEYQERAYVMLHKPAGYECSLKPSAWPSVHGLLPAALRQRPRKGAQPGVQAVGRLDQDTTGLLLLSDDGQFIHRMSSPRHHVPKVYEVRTAEAVTPDQVRRMLEGVDLEDGRGQERVRALDCTVAGERLIRLTLGEGKYHQVKRMLAAVGNAVEGLHRSRIGGLELPADLAPGAWRWLLPADLQAAGLVQASIPDIAG